MDNLLKDMGKRIFDRRKQLNMWKVFYNKQFTDMTKTLIQFYLINKNY